MDPQTVIKGAAIGVVVLIVITAIYIGRRLYNERKQIDDLESNNKILRQLELELEPPTDRIEEIKEATQIFLQPSKLNSPKDSLEGSTAISSQEIKSPSINTSMRSSSSYNKRIETGSNSSSPQNSRNGSQYGSKRISKSVSKRSINSIITNNSRKNIPPPPPPSPLRSRPNSIEIDLSSSNVLSSDTSNTTPPSSQPSSKVQSRLASPVSSKSDSKAYSSRSIPQVFRQYSNPELSERSPE